MTTYQPVVVIPTYNTGSRLLQETVEDVLVLKIPVKVVVDGSTDGSDEILNQLELDNAHLTILRKTRNTGKGDALLMAANEAIREGYTHALVMDSDGQHPPERIPPMLQLAEKNPNALIMGQPLFGKDAPWMRVAGRKLTMFWTDMETLWCGLGDSLFGMRVYPLKPFIKAFEQTSFARGFEFDPEIAVRMCWAGCRPIGIEVPVKYLSSTEGGISHFHYMRDNLKLTLLHFRLVPEFIFLRSIPFTRKKRTWSKP